jgi:hypothetical protein
MIEGISAVTLGTHEMPRAVGFYRALSGLTLKNGHRQTGPVGPVGATRDSCTAAIGGVLRSLLRRGRTALEAKPARVVASDFP